jgi:hypothetical protein
MKRILIDSLILVGLLLSGQPAWAATDNLPLVFTEGMSGDPPDSVVAYVTDDTDSNVVARVSLGEQDRGRWIGTASSLTTGEWYHVIYEAYYDVAADTVRATWFGMMEDPADYYASGISDTLLWMTYARRAPEGFNLVKNPSFEYDMSSPGANVDPRRWHIEYRIDCQINQSAVASGLDDDFTASGKMELDFNTTTGNSDSAVAIVVSDAFFLDSTVAYAYGGHIYHTGASDYDSCKFSLVDAIDNSEVARVLIPIVRVWEDTTKYYFLPWGGVHSPDTSGMYRLKISWWDPDTASNAITRFDEMFCYPSTESGIIRDSLADLQAIADSVNAILDSIQAHAPHER